MNVEHWGLIDFQSAWDKQKELATQVLEGMPDTLVFCEHPDVITLGRATKNGALLAPMFELAGRGVQLVEIDRGGEATVHNPGQLVGYPIFNLTRTNPDLHWFLRTIEQCIINSMHHFGIESHRIEGRTGVWVENARKICAIGFHCRNWITTHGFALNVDNDLSLFDTIVPCGITDKGVTSMSRELQATVGLDKIQEVLAEQFALNFSTDVLAKTP